MIKHDFCLALLDIQMPVMSGLELATFMRGTNKTKGIPIIFVTAGTIGSKDQMKALNTFESGTVEFLRKPLDSHTIKSKVNFLLETYKQKKLSGLL